mgnify:CR=1 FL=1
MLRSKRDESIKRYLAHVGKLEHRSKLYNSVYYKVSYGEDIEIIVRFADHFNTEVKPKDIVKTSVGFYVIKLVLEYLQLSEKLRLRKDLKNLI